MHLTSHLPSSLINSATPFQVFSQVQNRNQNQNGTTHDRVTLGRETSGDRTSTVHNGTTAAALEAWFSESAASDEPPSESTDTSEQSPDEAPVGRRTGGTLAQLRRRRTTGTPSGNSTNAARPGGASIRKEARERAQEVSRSRGSAQLNRSIGDFIQRKARPALGFMQNAVKLGQRLIQKVPLSQQGPLRTMISVAQSLTSVIGPFLSGRPGEPIDLLQAARDAGAALNSTLQAIGALKEQITGKELGIRSVLKNGVPVVGTLVYAHDVASGLGKARQARDNGQEVKQMYYTFSAAFNMFGGFLQGVSDLLVLTGAGGGAAAPALVGLEMIGGGLGFAGDVTAELGRISNN